MDLSGSVAEKVQNPSNFPKKEQLTRMKRAFRPGRDKVQLVGFGSFEVRAKAARTGKNPRTGETINIPASKAPAFKAGKALKDAVSK